MSSIAVFMILGGATAFAAVQKIGANEIKANSIKTGKIVKEAVTAGKIKNAAVTEGKIADGVVTTNKLADSAVTAPKIAKDAVTTEKILNDAVTGDKVKESTLSQVPNAANAVNATNAAALGGLPASEYSQRMFARVNYTTATESLAAASPGISATTETLLGFPRLIFPRSVDNCAIIGNASSNAGTQVFRRSEGSSGAVVQFALKDDAGAAVRANFEVIALC
jgi:NADH dehydrogenase/NADH:ubiquinone oxidoreductase subunit G